ncbi:MAG: hypothetical protein M1275_00740 [Patescibacteria group bacterium]|nr:hypothetical protein [Patescibacteria group bacterium]
MQITTVSAIKAKALFQRQYFAGGALGPGPKGGWTSYQKLDKDAEIITEQWQCEGSGFTITQTRLLLDGKPVRIVGMRPGLDDTVVAIGIESPAYSQIEIYTDILTHKGESDGVANPDQP